LLPLLNRKIDLLKVYWYFPYVNAVFGFMLFWLVVWDKI